MIDEILDQVYPIVNLMIFSSTCVESLKSEEKLITQVTLIKDNAPVLVEKKQQGAQQTKHTKKYFRVSI